MACEEGVGGDAAEEIMMTPIPSQTNSNTDPALPRPTSREVDHEAQSNVVSHEGAGENDIHEMNSGPSRIRGMYGMLLRQWLSQ